uniref:3-dehydroquinate dehydratase n=1 Tax=Candidatus Kentrum eta TaxID=2126337 RepID=A0A450UZD7_9GAMM|nr:MAG: 3-dehydroquinate dehydratase [Candidatus Kentron sp. H]VFJ97930.1 MAG: 3-dehydroquinate dehydratase [Candidatus Kentron sp. H]VFK03438.1 MAG: 3-dehydroquinate dehydratase [Candidatus Kentron sp. H]
MAKLLLLHGPNLNLLGEREPTLYGNHGLVEINRQLVISARERGHELVCFQSNAEHELVDRIQMAREQDIEFIIINPAAFTHTSIAIRDAFLAVAVPFIEVHLSNVYRREPFRHHSYLSDIAVGVIVGFGPEGYGLALRAAMARVSQEVAKES